MTKKNIKQEAVTVEEGVSAVEAVVEKSSPLELLIESALFDGKKIGSRQLPGTVSKGPDELAKVISCFSCEFPEEERSLVRAAVTVLKYVDAKTEQKSRFSDLALFFHSTELVEEKVKVFLENSTKDEKLSDSTKAFYEAIAIMLSKDYFNEVTYLEMSSLRARLMMLAS